MTVILDEQTDGEAGATAALAHPYTYAHVHTLVSQPCVCPLGVRLCYDCGCGDSYGFFALK